MRTKIAVILFLMVQALPALAYIGPGSGISLLGGLWGVLVAIVLAVGAVLIWPIRYAFRRLRRKRAGADVPDATGATEEADTEQSSNRPD